MGMAAGESDGEVEDCFGSPGEREWANFGGSKFIPIPNEVGWSDAMPRRCEQHESLRLGISPILFQRAEWLRAPAIGFSFVTRWSHKYGGFNTKQAGSSVASKDKLGNDDTARVMERFELNGSILVQDENHARELELAQKMLAAEQKISQDRQPMTEQELKDALLYQNRRVLEVGLKLDIVQGQARENVLLQSCPRRLIGALKMFWLWRD
ncbi:hypothetical protein LTR22_007316 [Elasticomyces elasticus]|nr:hypothetical protein LTR22_007316 [Elasticomyces elasticus]